MLVRSGQTVTVCALVFPVRISVFLASFVYFGLQLFVDVSKHSSADDVENKTMTCVTAFDDASTHIMTHT